MPALEIALKGIGHVDGYIILGDVVNYGPWSNECVLLLEQLDNCIKLLGNHDEDFIKGECSCNNILAKEFFEHCYQNFNSHMCLNMYEKSYIFCGYTFIHTIKNKYIFKDSNIILDKNYIVGHSHKQFKTIRNGYNLINPGSVGQNRSYINEINYMTYEPPDKIKFFSTLYDIELIIKKMKDRKYPASCINYYLNKKFK